MEVGSRRVVVTGSRWDMVDLHRPDAEILSGNRHVDLDLSFVDFLSPI